MPAPPPQATLDAVLASLDRLHTRLDSLEARVNDAAAHAPAVVATVIDTLDGWAEHAGPADLDARAHAAGRLLARLTAPDTLAALEALAGRVTALERVAALADTAPGAVAMVVDTLDDLALRLAERGPPLHERIATALALADTLTTPETLALAQALAPRLPALRRLLESGLLEPATLATLEAAARAIGETAAQGAAAAGPLTALGALRDGDTQRAVGFLLAFSRRLGATLPSPAARLTSAPESG